MAEATEDFEPDRLAGAPHPRDQLSFFGHAGAERAVLDSLRSGRLHHAWLLGGPQGVGKATFAYRVARYLLALGDVPGASLTIDAGNAVLRQVSAQAHGGLVVLRRGLNEQGKPSTVIRVPDVRKAISLFEQTAANGGHRVLILDSAEDMNREAANAILKTLEEPPPRCTIFIVTHQPRRVLPTIRSRCRRLDFAPLPETDVRDVLRSINQTSRSEDLVTAAVALGEGSARRTIEMLDADKIAVVREVEDLLGQLPRQDLKRVLALSEKLAKKDAEAEYELAVETVQRWASGRLQALAAAGPRRLAPMVEVCEKVAEAARAVDTYNLDRRPLIVSMFGDLAAAVQRAA